MPLIYKNLEEVLDALEQIAAHKVEATGQWDVVQHLNHCGQSVEYSMIGYPVNKPWLMQETIGKLAFGIFSWRGYVQHDTNKLAPGAKEIVSTSLKDSILYLSNAIIRFDNFSDPLKPHEFYGRLSKKQFEQAHTMHIANHLEKISIID